MPDKPDEADVAQRLDAAGRRLAEMSAEMDDTKRRQDEIQRRQEELLDQLARLSRAMDDAAEGEQRGPGGD